MTALVESLPVKNLDALLRPSLGNDFQIKNVQWKPLTNPGENFGSIIFALNVALVRNKKEETLHLVAKLPPNSEYLLELFNSPVTFKKELQFYSDIAREFQSLQHETESNAVFPKYFGGRLGLRNSEEFDEQAVIILENLKYSGYVTKDRIRGLDKKHTQFAVKELAKFHATVIALKLKKPQFFETVMLGALQQSVNETAKKCVIDMVRKAQADITRIDEAKIFMDDVNRTIEYGIEMYGNPNMPEEPWPTLVHNDFWVNNMMFQENENGDLIDMKIVDFQLYIYDYGMSDLIFFLISSGNKEVLDNHLSDMIDLYYDTFVEQLQALEVDRKKFPRNKFDRFMNECAPIKFMQCIMMVQVIQASPKRDEEDRSTEGGSIFQGSVEDEACREKLLHIVTTFDKRGWLMK